MRCLLACMLVFSGAAVLLGQQPNQPSASMVFNNIEGPPWPITGVNLPRGQSSQLAIHGNPSSVFVVAGSPALAATPSFTLGGIVELDLQTLFFTLNGLEQPWAFSTDAMGSWSSPLPIPATASLYSEAVFQAMVADTTSAFGVSLSAATVVQISPGVTTQGLNLGDDDFINFVLAPFGLALPFYGQTYSNLYVNSNGSVSFTQGSTDFSSDPGEFLGQMPRIAGFWTDLSPPQGGMITVTIDQTALIPWVRVDFSNVAELGAGPSHTFSIQIFSLSGDIVITQSPQNLGGQYPILCGISPGYDLSNHAQKNLSALTAAPLVGMVDESFYEWFGLTHMPFYTAGFNNPWDLAGRTLVFHGQSPGMSSASYIATGSP